MPRKARKLSSCGVYHIMIRGINRMTIFNDDADNLNFLHILDFCADENFIIMAYCLMGNHLHLLAKDCNDSLQHMMKAIGVRYGTLPTTTAATSGQARSSRAVTNPSLSQPKATSCGYCAISTATRSLPEWCRICRTTRGAATLTTLLVEKSRYVM